MAEEKKEVKKEGHPIENLIFIVVMLLAVGVLWVATGGPERARQQKGGILLPSSPEATGGYNVPTTGYNAPSAGAGGTNGN